MKTIINTLRITFLFCLFIGSKAWGQIGNPGIMYQGAFNNAMFLTTKSAIERGMKGTSDSKRTQIKQSKIPNTDLNFVTTAQVQSKVLELISTIAAKGNKDRIKPALETIKQGNFLVQFDNLIKPYGFNSHNMSDVFTAFIILSWQAIHGEDVSQYRGGIKLLRQQIHETMDNNETLLKFNNDQKQEISEILSYMAIFFTYVIQDQTKKGDFSLLKATRENIRQATIKVSGIDLTKHTFTNKGLTDR